MSNVVDVGRLQRKLDGIAIEAARGSGYQLIAARSGA